MELAVKAGDADIEARPFDWEKLDEEDWQEWPRGRVRLRLDEVSVLFLDEIHLRQHKPARFALLGEGDHQRQGHQASPPSIQIRR